MSLPDLTLAEAEAALRRGEFSSRALVAAHLDRIATRDPQLGAFVTVAADAALAAAEQADGELAEGGDRGPLHGLPIAIKDMIDTAGLRTTYGSKLHVEQVPEADATVVERLRAGGAIVIGKVATYEFATVGPATDLPFPTPRNPWRLDHFTGGSSSGSASAVGGGLVRAAIGTDTGGSVRSPAAYCGIVGLKPTFGRIPKDGVFPLSPSLDVVGPLAASVSDAALVFDVLAGTTEASSAIGQPLDQLRIGYARTWFASDPQLEAGLLPLVDAAASQLSLLGARIDEVTLPDYELFEAAGAVILHAEAFDLHRERLARDGDSYGRKAFATLVAGAALTAADLASARQVGSDLRTALDSRMSSFDAIVTITTLSTALPFSAFDGDKAVWTAMRTLAFNVTGHPVLTVPVGFRNGLPVGMQIVGPHLSEAMLCRIGHAFEQATDHSILNPALAFLDAAPIRRSA